MLDWFFKMFKDTTPRWEIDAREKKFIVCRYDGVKLLGDPVYKSVGIFDTLEEARSAMEHYAGFPQYYNEDLKRVHLDPNK